MRFALWLFACITAAAAAKSPSVAFGTPVLVGSSNSSTPDGSAFWFPCISIPTGIPGHVAQHITLSGDGGGMCQHEDTIQPYFEATKKLYKDLLAVRKHPDNGSIEVVSQVISVRRPGFKSDGAGLFAGKSPFSFCYLIVNPVKRSATIVHFPWTSVWGH